MVHTESVDCSEMFSSISESLNALNIVKLTMFCYQCIYSLIKLYLCTKSHGGSVSILTRLGDGCPGLDSQQGQGYFLYATKSRLAIGPTPPPSQWLLGGSFLQE